MPMLPPPPSIKWEPYRAEIEGNGWFGWNVYVRNGLTQYGPDGGSFLWFGSRERVTRKAQRLLAQLNHPAETERFTVREED